MKTQIIRNTMFSKGRISGCVLGIFFLFTCNLMAQHITSPPAEMQRPTLYDPIPVELLYFNVEWYGREIVLSWDAREEWSLVGYQVERSYDGIHYERVGWVWCREISREIFYEFTDSTYNVNQPCYYRLKMVDFGGNMEFTPIRIAFPVSH